MNPLEPNDSLWKLLGRARQVKVRGSFTQDVVRAARNTPQDHGFWAAVSAWFGSSTVLLRTAAVAAAVAVVSLAGWRSFDQPAAQVVAQQVAPVPEISSLDAAEMIQLVEAMPTLPLETAAEMNALLALHDASAMTDKELVSLLY
jgi:hypothetical protein